MNRLVAGAGACALAAALGCGGGGSPTSPSPPAQTAPPVSTPVTASLTGTVSSSAGLRIGAATVSVLNGPNSGRSTTTNSSGEYRLDSMQTGSANLVARASGYQDQTLSVNITGSPVLNFNLQAIQAAPSPFTGTWRGRIQSTSCAGDGNFGGSWCTQNPTLSDTIVLTLTQSGNTVAGSINVGGFDANATNGAVTGNRLSISGQANRPGNISVGYESWDSTVSGSSMVGDFVVRFFATSGSPSGSARYRVNLVGVARTAP